MHTHTHNTRTHTHTHTHAQKLNEFLEQPGADPNIHNDAGDTPLLHYVRNQHKSRLEQLCMILYHGRGIKVDARDAAGNTAVHIAAQVCHACYGVPSTGAFRKLQI